MKYVHESIFIIYCKIHKLIEIMIEKEGKEENDQ